jgi:two-component system response regulator RegX3
VTLDADRQDVEPERLAIGDVVVDRAAHLVLVRGTALHLALREFRVLELLMSHADRVLENGAILDAIWGPGFEGDPSTVSVHVLRIRRKLDRGGGAGGHLRTVRGIGYVFDSTPITEVS